MCKQYVGYFNKREVCNLFGDMDFMKIVGIVKRILLKTYSILNPQYKHIKRTRDTAYEISDRLGEIENKLGRLERLLAENNNDELFLLSDEIIYRYMYLRRYISGHERVLDLEGMYGQGLKAVARYMPIDKGVCCNSVGYYTNLGTVSSSEYDTVLEYVTGTIFDIKEKYDIITAFNENKNEAIDAEYVTKISSTTERGGIVALALSKEKEEELMPKLVEAGLDLIIRLFQHYDSPQLIEHTDDNVISVLYLRKNE